MTPHSFEHSQLHVLRKYFRNQRAGYRLQWVPKKVIEHLADSSQQSPHCKQIIFCCLTFKIIPIIIVATTTSTRIDARLTWPPVTVPRGSRMPRPMVNSMCKVISKRGNCLPDCIQHKFYTRVLKLGPCANGAQTQICGAPQLTPDTSPSRKI